MYKEEGNYPYHVIFTTLRHPEYYNPKYPNFYHTHDFQHLKQIAKREHYSFYLTTEDKKHYTKEQIEQLEEITGRKL